MCLEILWTIGENLVGMKRIGINKTKSKAKISSIQKGVYENNIFRY